MRSLGLAPPGIWIAAAGAALRPREPQRLPRWNSRALVEAVAAPITTHKNVTTAYTPKIINGDA